MPPRYDLTEQLINHARGLHAASAAIELLCTHRAWLDKPAFVDRCTTTGGSASGERYAYIDWSEAIAALDAGRIHGSGSENNILRIAASLGDPGIPVQLACVLGNLDLTNIGLVTAAIVRANGSSDGPGQHPVARSGVVRQPIRTPNVTPDWQQPEAGNKWPEHLQLKR